MARALERWAVAILASAAIACTSRTLDPLITAAGPGDLVVSAILSPTGQLTAAALLDADGFDRVNIEERERVVVWTIRAADLVGEDHLPLSPERLGEVRVRLTRAPADPDRGACRRCLGRVAAPPQIISAGDSCPVPAFAEVLVRGVDARPVEISGEHRDGLRLEWPGACACGSGATLALDRAEIVGRRAGEWPVEVAAQAADGSVGLFGARLARRVAVDGTVRDGTIPVEGFLTSGAGALDGSFVLASQTRAQWQNRGLLVDPGFEPHPLGALPFVAYRMKRIRGFDAIFVAGSANPGEGGLFACEVEGASSRVACQSILPSAQVVGKWLGDVASAGPRQVVTVGDQGAYAVGRLDGSTDRWEFVADSVFGRSFVIPGTGEMRTASELATVASIGSRLYACGTGDRPDGGYDRLLLSAIAPAMSVPLALIEWSAVAAVPADFCGRFAEVPGRPDRLRISFPGTSITFEVGSDPSDAAQIEHDPYALESVTPDWTLGTTEGRNVYRQSSTTAAPLEQVYGSTVSFDAPYPAVAARGRAFYTFGTDPLIIEPGAVAETRASAVDRFTAADEPTVARYDPSTDTFLVIGLSEGQPWLKRLSPDGGGQTIELGALAGEMLIGLAHLSRGRFVVASASRLWLLEGDRLDPLPIDWDDPATAELEGTPRVTEPQRCYLPRYRSNVGPTPLWMSLEGAGRGVAFAGGCDGALVRIGPSGVQRVSVLGPNLQNEPTRLGARPPAISAIRAACADQVEVAATGRNESQELARVWAIFARSEDGAPVIGDHPELRGLRGDTSGMPVAIFGTFENPQVLLSFGIPRGVFLSADGAALLPFGTRLRAWAENEHGEALLSTEEGFLLLLRPSR